MTRQRRPEDARYWLEQADERLEHARGYAAGRSARILCEQAHYAAEFAVKGVIIARGSSFSTIHDIRALLQAAREAGETIPAAVERATGLSTYSGSGRYDFDRNPEFGPVGRAEYDRAVESASAVVEWARGRIDWMLEGDEQRRTPKSRDPE